MSIKISFKIIPLSHSVCDKSYNFTKSEPVYLPASEIGNVVIEPGSCATVLHFKKGLQKLRGIDRERLLLILPSNKYVEKYIKKDSYGACYSYEKVYGTILQDYISFKEVHNNKLFLLFVYRKPRNERVGTRFRSPCKAPIYHTLRCLSCDCINF